MEKYTNLIGDIYEKDGTLYIEEGDGYTPIQFDDHGDKGLCVLCRENVRNMESEGYEDSNRNFCTAISLPSELLQFDLKTNRGLDDEEVDVIIDFFSDELKSADDSQQEWIKPNEKEAIEDDFSEWLSEEEENRKFESEYNGTELEEWTSDQKSLDYLEEVQNFRRGFIPQFHDEDEIREICRNYLKK